MKAVNQADFAASPSRSPSFARNFPILPGKHLVFGGKRKRHSRILDPISVGPTTT